MTNRSAAVAPPTIMHRPDAAAKILHVGAGCLAKWRSAGVGPAFLRVGSKILYRQVDLEAYLERRRVVPSETQAAAT